MLEDRVFFICAVLYLCPRSGVWWWLHGVCADFALRAAVVVIFTRCRCSGGSAPLHPRVGVGASRQKAPSRVQMREKAGKAGAVCGGSGRRDGVRGDSGGWNWTLCVANLIRHGALRRATFPCKGEGTCCTCVASGGKKVRILSDGRKRENVRFADIMKKRGKSPGRGCK